MVDEVRFLRTGGVRAAKIFLKAADGWNRVVRLEPEPHARNKNSPVRQSGSHRRAEGNVPCAWASCFTTARPDLTP